MKENIGVVDRMARFVIGVFATYLGFKLNFAFFILAAFSFFEVFASWCLVYEIIGMNTCTKKENDNTESKKSKKDKSII